MRRTLAGARVGLVLIAAAALLQGGPADAQAPAAGTVSLGGYQGSAGASGVHVLYNPEGVLPVAAPVDLGAPDALATIASGPSTFARASSADPGDLLANPDALLQQAGQAPGTVPAYPYRITASSGVGEPSSELSPAPGLDTRVSADATGSSTLATMPNLAAPSALTAGSMSSTATTSTDGVTVTVHAVSSISDLDLLGLLTIDSVVTDLTATSDGTTTTVTGGTVVSGAALAGQPVEIDESGIEGLGAALDDALAALGVRVAVAGPVQQGAGTASQLTAAGLRIDFELSDATFPVLDDVLDLVPPLPPLAPGAPSVDDALAVVQARHLVSIHLAGGSVSLSARPATPRRVVPPVAAPAAPSAGAAPSSSGVVPARPATPTPVPSAALSPAAPVATIAAAPAAISLAQGIGVAAVLLLLFQPFIGGALARGAARMTAAGPADHCPREGT